MSMINKFGVNVWMCVAKTVQRGKEHIKDDGFRGRPRAAANTALASPQAHSNQVHAVESDLVELSQVC
jgi:hypothetical protein